MKIVISVVLLAVVLAILIIAAFRALIVCCIKYYFVHKAKKMTDMELIGAQVKEWEDGWFHNLKYEIYCKEFQNRPGFIPPSDAD